MTPTNAASGVMFTWSPEACAVPSPLSMATDNSLSGVSGKGLMSFAKAGTVILSP